MIEKNKKEKFNFEIVDKFDEEDFFDDCPICQAMKQAQKESRELSLPELKDAFSKAKAKGGVVGGEWFENNKKKEN